MNRRLLLYSALASVVAAFLWAMYYPLVLWATPGTAPSAILVYPFIVGGMAYAVWAVLAGHGRAFLDLWRDPLSYVRIALMFGMMVAVLAATYLAGPVDSALLSLIGDVILSPIVVGLAFVAYRAQIATPLFAAGLVVSLVGGAMAIVGGQSLSAVHGWGWLTVPGIPLTVAFYFLLTAQANRTYPPAAVVGQSTLGAALLTIAISPFLPGGWPGLVSVGWWPLFLLVVCGITSFFLAAVLYFGALNAIGYVIPPMLMTGIPVFTLVLSATVLGIAPPLIGVLGIPVAVVGALLALRGGLTEAAEEEPPSSAQPQV